MIIFPFYKYISVCLFLSILTGCYAHSPMQNAKVLDSGEFNFVASTSVETFVHFGANEDAQNYVGSQMALFTNYGLNKWVNLLTTFNYIDNRDPYPSMIYLSGGLKVPIISNRLAISVKGFNYFFEESQSFDSYGLDFMVVYSFWETKYSLLSTIVGFNYFVEDVNPPYYTVFSADLGPDISRWAVKPEISISTLNPPTGVYLSWNLGFSYYLNMF